MLEARESCAQAVAHPQLLTTAYWVFTPLTLRSNRALCLWLRWSSLRCVSALVWTQTPLPKQQLGTHRKSGCHTRPSAQTLKSAFQAALASHLASPTVCSTSLPAPMPPPPCTLPQFLIALDSALFQFFVYPSTHPSMATGSFTGL